MFMWINKRLRDEEGFTLIELMVVVLIIAILIAIAIPTFLGARRRAQDRQAQSNLRNALTAEKTFYSDKQAYTATGSDLESIESSLSYVTSGTALAKNREVKIELGATDQVTCLTTQSASGTTFVLGDIAASSTQSNIGTWYRSAAVASCTEGNLVASGGSKSGW
jgi:type IV pilus assembly protein PilA